MIFSTDQPESKSNEQVHDSLRPSGLPAQSSSPPQVIPASKLPPLLPTELILHVFSFIPPDAKLYPILFAGPGFRAEVERRLYPNLLLMGDWIDGDKPSIGYQPVENRVKLFKTLQHTPR